MLHFDFDTVTSLVSQNFINYRSDTSTSGPRGLHDSLCTLHLFCSSVAVHTAEKQFLIPDSAAGATLDTDGWLILTRLELAPRKMHQVSLDALTHLFGAAGTKRKMSQPRLFAATTQTCYKPITIYLNPAL